MAIDPPRIGALRDRIRFERPGLQSNVGGVVSGPWDIIVQPRWASVQPTRGGDAIIAGRMDGTASYDIWVRFDTDTRGVRNGDRAVNERSGEVYRLGSPIDPEGGRNRWLLIQAESEGFPKPQGA